MDSNETKSRQYSDEDISLAKNLSSFGVKSVKKKCGAVFFVFNGLLAKLPNGVFDFMEDEETVTLEEIIKEREGMERLTNELCKDDVLDTKKESRYNGKLQTRGV